MTILPTHNDVKMPATAGGAPAQSDKRTQILKMLRALQGQLRGLYETLSSVGGGADQIDLRLQLMRQIEAVKSEIAALQNALQLADGNKAVSVVPAGARPGQSDDPLDIYANTGQSADGQQSKPGGAVDTTA